MISMQVRIEVISRCEHPLASWLFSGTGIGGSLRPMEIHKVTSNVTLTTLVNPGTKNAEVSSASGCWTGIFSN